MQLSNYFFDKTLKADDCLDIKGSLKDWQENIAKYAYGNDLMSFCLFMPFGSCWYKPLAEQPLIFHIYGESRKGKTILLNLAGGVLGFTGNMGYANWNSTLVALENLAAIKNDNLLILDELGFKQLPKYSTDDFFNVISKRYETKSTIITTNKIIDQWNDIFDEQVLTRAIVDRIMHHASIISINGKSFRMKTKNQNKKEAT